MRLKGLTPIITPAAVLATGIAVLALTLSLRVPSVAASNAQNGQLHVTKECSQYTGSSGSFCTITSSNLAAIKVGSKVYYDQAEGTPAGMLDSNIVLYGGIGEWAAGRCTLDGSTGSGLCTFSDGTGSFAGFSGRVRVTTKDGINFEWDGTYGFDPLPSR